MDELRSSDVGGLPAGNLGDDIVVELVTDVPDRDPYLLVSVKRPAGVPYKWIGREAELLCDCCETPADLSWTDSEQFPEYGTYLVKPTCPYCGETEQRLVEHYVDAHVGPGGETQVHFATDDDSSFIARTQ